MRRGFTLVELLVVMVIIGVMVMMIGPTFSAGSDAARVRTAARGVMQVSRYARTMALLHQTPVDLIFTSQGGLSVVSAGGGGESLVSARSFAVTNSAAEAERAAEAEAEAEAGKGGTEQAGGSGGGAAYEMADLGLEKGYEQVAFVFEGYTDTVSEGRGGRRPAFAGGLAEEEDAELGAEEVQTFRVRYKSNGTCRPYKVRVSAAGDESCAMTVAVDMLGAGMVEEDE
jgi:prepilin-type N-terminal cleavage/methylation domain-containing protein